MCIRDRSYGCENFTGTVKNIVYKEDYMMLYMKDNSLNKQGIIAVSYTHLDVYKRQDIPSDIRLF